MKVLIERIAAAVEFAHDRLCRRCRF